jgi:hypothetical protein
LKIIKGYFDVNNVESFLVNVEILEDSYPNPYRRILQSILSEWLNFRGESELTGAADITLFGQSIKKELNKPA